MSKLHPSTLCNFKLCDETSITITLHPPSYIFANNCCNFMLSGVVLSLSSNLCSPLYDAIVPTKPVFIPCFSNIFFIINVVVVFPFVPVTPINFTFLDGLS